MKFRRFAVDASKFNLIDKVLNSSHGNSFRPQAGKAIPDMCVMEAASWVTGRESKTDHPECTDGHLTSFCISMNDALSEGSWFDEEKRVYVSADELRAKYLKPLIPAIINTRLIVHYVSPEEKAKGYLPGTVIDIPRSEQTTTLLNQLMNTHHSWMDELRHQSLDVVEQKLTERTDRIRALAKSMKQDIADYRVAQGWSRPRPTTLLEDLADQEACEVIFAQKMPVTESVPS